MRAKVWGASSLKPMASKTSESEKVRSSIVHTKVIESAGVVRVLGLHKIDLYTVSVFKSGCHPTFVQLLLL